MENAKRIAPWICAGILALLFLYMGLGKLLRFDPEITTEIFRRVGIWLGMGYVINGGPYVVGIIEIVAAVLLVTRKGQPYGALIAFVVLTGALFLHLLGPIGLSVQVVNETWNAEAGALERTVNGDGGSIFAMAVVGWVFAAALLWLRRAEIDLRADSAPSAAAGS